MAPSAHSIAMARSNVARTSPILPPSASKASADESAGVIISLVRASAGRASFDFGRRGGCRALADDQQYGILRLGAVKMHLLTEMGHERARRHRHRSIGIKLGAAADPPGSAQHCDEAIVRVEMRIAEMVSRGPFGHNDVKTFLCRIASENRTVCTRCTRWSPLDLIRQLESDGGGIELACASKC